jgi:glycosyltransferase involved in cell wall biosynthesis
MSGPATANTPAASAASKPGGNRTPKAVGLVVSVNWWGDPKFRWYEDKLAGGPRWAHYNAVPSNWLERRKRNSNLAQARNAWQAVRSAHRNGAGLMISHGPGTTFYVAMFARLTRLSVPHVAWSFNFNERPRGLWRRLMTWAFPAVDRFIVYSEAERAVYAKTFGLPIGRFEKLFWGAAEPATANPDAPLILGDYICTVGGNQRDYPTLMAAMARCPAVRLIAVMRPENAAGLDVPPNVEIHLNLPLATVHNIMRFSRFVVIPLLGSEVPCGHLTVVSAMHHGRPFLITSSSGVADYVVEGENALTFAPGDPESLAERIAELWSQPERCARMGEAARAFAHAHCTEQSVIDHLTGMLRAYGMMETA